MNVIYKKMNLPDSCLVGNTIFKKLFYENASMNASDKDIFVENIAKITWQYSLKEETINISSYSDEEREYEEIAVIEVELNDNKKYKRIAEIIQKTVPYPLILTFIYEGQFLLNLAHKRRNKGDESKNTLEEMIYSDWKSIEEFTSVEFDAKKFSYTNFFKYYTDAYNQIIKMNASKFNENEKITFNIDAEEIKEIYKNIEDTENEILSLRGLIKKETQMSKIIEMNISIKQLEQKKQNLINRLNE
ncbi:DUF4391 domain-containing protein [Fusibacter tunisiensis]|uniref:DUF4391 domain-containing protein n=1 Tax=Fusibacter tunisiensis TaxID=1008308 RepID=A0ABS2MSX1_9FIRM|nr:DUF4391 domain-containing protein [Fusibacter tunisiensis]MBM7562507.1 hypothetical protein [Fusibacter tunisiensis]